MINKDLRFFLKKFLLFCLVLTGMSLLLFDTVLKEMYLKIFPVQFALVAAVTFLSHLRLMKSFDQNIRKFSTTFLSTMSVKLFIYMVFIIICLLIDRSHAVNFVLTFLILYLCFTTFEVIEISDFLKKNQKSSNY
jgi:hypothetical protein